MTLHYTTPQQEVVIDADDVYLDISTLGDKPVSYDAKFKTDKRVKISITFDANRVDELAAVKFLNKLQTYLNNTDTMLL